MEKRLGIMCDHKVPTKLEGKF